MYLTRSKLLAAGLVLVGILTTSAGVLSRADAQPQPGGPSDEAIRKYYEALRTAQTPKDRWEYKFIPVDRPLSTAELRTVLAQGDQEGWAYCGSQELVAEKTGKAGPHMVFKRPRAGGVAADEAPVRKEAAAAALLAEQFARDLATKMQGAQDARRQQAEAERARAEAAAQDAVRNKKLADDKAAADRERQDVEGKVRAELEKALQQQRAAAREAAAAEKTLLERDAAMRKELEAMKARYEELINKLQQELKAKQAAPPAKADPSNKKPGPQAGNNPFGSTVEEVSPDRPITALVQLEHVDGKTVVGSLAKVAPGVKVVEVTPTTITLNGPAKLVVEARDAIRKQVDVADPAKAKAGGDGRNEVAVVRLQHANAADVVKVLEKAHASTVARFTADAASNSIVISAPPGMMANLKKLVAEVDKPAGPAK